MIKIAITANTSWYLYNFRKNTIISLIENGFEVYTISPFDEYSKKLENLGTKHVNIKIDSASKNPFIDLYTLISFYRIFNKFKFNAILNFTPKNNIYATLAAKFNQIETINNIAGLGTLFVNDNISSKLARNLYRYSQKYANKIFFQNNDDLTLFLEKNYVKTSQIDRLPGSGVDLSRFTLSLSKNKEKLRFLLIARMLYEKGITFYVDAARILKEKHGNNVEFCLLGFVGVNNPSAITHEQMNSWISEGIINYLGTTDSVEYEIAKADCIVLPSFYREGVPKTLLEAGAMGKPIITTDNVGCRETVTHGLNGYLCQPKSVSSLVDAIDTFINLPYEKKLEMGKNSRKKIESEFDEQIVIKKYLDALKEIL
ncbi:glycosyltransferase family 4 protein [Proteus alimentorum]|uniref:Glycosyltransferase family 4 protein n=1 Tax=Proteus alimentorum TaxID=1973495 RepID=A0ABS0ISE9_9GAMM|nr:glycosyltransferase family 4 protein [Proteus alimentorum]MBG2875362.1 glycosyltransferase family 4 protein [Proteus alimentorum]MBG2878327.1 glycosyltransferase family 4 protein [Proteus alimentorum]